MSFYQACYTRVGKQGREAGWTVVSATEGLSKMALERFRTMISQVIREKNLYEERPSEIFLVQADEKFVYLCNIVLDCSGDDGRGNSLAHGYIIGKHEYYGRCMQPEAVFGIEESEFIKDISMAGRGLPKKESFQCRPWDRSMVMAVYGLESCYRDLLRCVLSVLEREYASLCICVRPKDGEDIKEAGRKIMLCILEDIPYALRPKLTCASFAAGGTKLSFSSDVPRSGCEYFDLETGTRNCNTACTAEYAFVSSLTRGERKETIWRNTEIFIDTVFMKNRYADIKYDLLESIYGYCAGLKRNTEPKQLRQFLAANPAACPLCRQYLLFLTARMDVRQIDEGSAKKLWDLYGRNGDPAFEAVFLSQTGEGTGRWDAALADTPVCKKRVTGKLAHIFKVSFGDIMKKLQKMIGRYSR